MLHSCVRNTRPSSSFVTTERKHLKASEQNIYLPCRRILHWLKKPYGLFKNGQPAALDFTSVTKQIGDVAKCSAEISMFYGRIWHRGEVRGLNKPYCHPVRPAFRLLYKRCGFSVYRKPTTGNLYIFCEVSPLFFLTSGLHYLLMLN